MMKAVMAFCPLWDEALSIAVIVFQYRYTLNLRAPFGLAI
jgi:hypothetical protein